VVLEVADVAVRDQLPRPGMDVEVAVGEPSLTCSFIALVAVLEVAEEILREVLDDGDVLRADCEPVADGLLDVALVVGSLKEAGSLYSGRPTSQLLPQLTKR
jgi:hypothetical protein